MPCILVIDPHIFLLHLSHTDHQATWGLPAFCAIFALLLAPWENGFLLLMPCRGVWDPGGLLPEHHSWHFFCSWAMLLPPALLRKGGSRLYCVSGSQLLLCFGPQPKEYGQKGFQGTIILYCSHLPKPYASPSPDSINNMSRLSGRQSFLKITHKAEFPLNCMGIKCGPRLP